MSDIQPLLLLNYFLFLCIPFAVGYVFRLFKVPPIVGYIIGGIIVGNFFGELVNSETINSFAFFGIVLLMFTIGLEINLSRIIALKKFIVIGGLLQIVLSISFISLISSVFGFTFVQSLLIGIAFASSSTSLVAKIIQDRGEESSFLGELAVGILMFQDLAFIPFIIIFTFFNNQIGSYGELVKRVVFAISEAGLILIIMYYLGRKIVPPIFNKIAETSRELLNLFIIVFIFLIAYLSAMLGIPTLIGTFVAGVLVSQTKEHYHIFSQIRPLRDLLAIMFFVYIGTHIQLSAVLVSLPQILVFAAFIVFIKALILLGIFLYFRFSSRMAFSIAVFLFQVSENAFILLSLAFTNRIFNQQQYLFIITAVLISLISTPFLINNRDKLYGVIRKFFKQYVPTLELYIRHRIDFNPAPVDVIDMKNHVVICGYGRVGSYVGRALTLAGIPFIAVDYNFHTVQKNRQKGVNIIYGDPTDIDILDYAQTEDAVALVSAVPSKYEQEAIVLNSKRLNKNIIVISRVHRPDHHQRLKDLGVDVVVQPEFEASLSIIRKLFMIKKVDQQEMINKIRHFKLEQGLL